MSRGQKLLLETPGRCSGSATEGGVLEKAPLPGVTPHPDRMVERAKARAFAWSTAPHGITAACCNGRCFQPSPHWLVSPLDAPARVLCVRSFFTTLPK